MTIVAITTGVNTNYQNHSYSQGRCNQRENESSFLPDTIEALKLGSREQANRLAINSLGSVRDKVCIYLDESPSSLEALELTLQLPGGPTWEDEFAMLQRELAIFKEKVVEKDFITNKRKLLKNILQLQKIYTLIPTTQEDRLLFKLGDKGVGMRPLEQAPTIEPETMSQAVKIIIAMKKNLSFKSHGMRSRTPAGKSKDLEMVPLIFDPASGKSHTRVNPPIHQAPELSGDVLDILRAKWSMQAMEAQCTGNTKGVRNTYFFSCSYLGQLNLCKSINWYL
ncbi:hypothetical protein MJO28_000934 [Puccinia striiformis f. sp. tritici]|uniref:Uncharacterized protein n=1 Tax=Puccinia striiformis f. sp. tritici TaxID=168172 RepID=A0ACC0EZC7_9BASI|nr:hypothetical protein MJO28_000934 [Puccinia striiformis f. sp. tritici]